MSDLRSNATDDRSLMGCSAASVGEYFPTFWLLIFFRAACNWR